MMEDIFIPPRGPKRRYHHGHKTADGGSREYHCYNAMRARCTNPKVPHYFRYGGRGITVCDRWLQGFVFFLEDMGRCPSPSHSIERRDNDAGYSPDNCYWADATAQANNRTTSKFLELNGKRMTQAQWAREIGIGQATLHARLKSGWTVEKALTRGLC
jgi:hypothetical protein